MCFKTMCPVCIYNIYLIVCQQCMLSPHKIGQWISDRVCSEPDLAYQVSISPDANRQFRIGAFLHMTTLHCYVLLAAS